MTLQFSRRFLPFERLVLGTIWGLLNPKGQELFAGQIRHINKVQRLIDWREVEFYCMSWFKVRWPTDVLFREKGEFVLGTVLLRHSGERVKVTVWCVGGHVFSLESPVPMKPLRRLTDLTVDNAYAGHHQYKQAAIQQHRLHSR